MSAPAKRRAAPARATVISDADLQHLFPPTSAANKNAIALVGILKARARGDVAIVVKDSVLADWLGWSKATVKRTKRTVRDAGVPVAGVTAYRRAEGDSRGQEFTATRWVLDRRWVPALREDEGVGSRQSPVVQEAPQVGSEQNRPLKVAENVGAEGAASPSSSSSDSPPEPERPPPPSTPQTEEPSVTEPKLAPLPLVAPPDRQQERGSPPLTSLVAELWRELEAENGADGARLAERLRRAAFLCCGTPFLAELALSRLAGELRDCGRHRLAAALTRPGDRSKVGQADVDSRSQP